MESPILKYDWDEHLRYDESARLISAITVERSCDKMISRRVVFKLPRFVGWMPRRKNTSTLTRPSEFAVVRLAVFPVNRVHD
mgnify:CR=1 FL=1